MVELRRQALHVIARDAGAGHDLVSFSTCGLFHIQAPPRGAVESRLRRTRGYVPRQSLGTRAFTLLLDEDWSDLPLTTPELRGYAISLFRRNQNMAVITVPRPLREKLG